MKAYYYKDEIEAGVDEVARGCLAGPVFTSAVVWPKEIDPSDSNIIVNDSKKLSRRRRLILKDYIEEYALDFSVSQIGNNTIDNINIFNATQKCMHDSLDKLNIYLDHIIVDGDKFKPYKDKTKSIVPYTCVVKGDSKYVPVASASILAKVYHDQYIEKLCDDNSLLDIYDWRNNMCYGTKKHIESIKKNGLTEYHRKTFGICNIYDA